MIITEKEKREPRAYTSKLIEGIEFNLFNAENLAKELLAWLSEDEVKEFATYYEYIEDEEDEEDE